ncbi:MAG: CDP-alcohol phosphatidyltransferase family protein [Thermomicrobiales bacterium]
MVSTRFADRVRTRIGFVGRIVAKTNLSPNAITVIGLVLNVVVAAVISTGNLILGGALLLIAGGFDVVDGAVARATNKVSRFGSFFDSTMDRYADAIILGGVLLYFINDDAGSWPIMLVFITLVGSLMISYARSKAESIGLRGDVGFAQRAERVIILAAGLMIGYPAWAIGILAVLTQFTVLQRILHVWRELKLTESDR